MMSRTVEEVVFSLLPACYKVTLLDKRYHSAGRWICGQTYERIHSLYNGIARVVLLVGMLQLTT